MITRIGKTRHGWYVERRSMRGLRSMRQGSLWDVVKFVVVPKRYYVWKYARQSRKVLGLG